MIKSFRQVQFYKDPDSELTSKIYRLVEHESYTAISLFEGLACPWFLVSDVY